MKELFEKVYIKSEDDIPKEKGTYIVHLNYGKIAYRFDYIDIDYWEDVDWYLRPIEHDCYPADFIHWFYYTCGKYFPLQINDEPKMYKSHGEASYKNLDELYTYWLTIKDKK